MEASAYRALNSGRLDEAKRQFQTLLEKQPNNPRALSGMGYVYMKQQNFAEAADYLERARAAGARGLDSAIATSRFWEKMSRQAMLCKSGNTEAAIDTYDAALSLKPSVPRRWKVSPGPMRRQGIIRSSGHIMSAPCALPGAGRRRGEDSFLRNRMAGDSQAALATSDRMPQRRSCSIE